MVAACVKVWRDERAGLPRAGTIGKRWRAVPLIEPVGLSSDRMTWGRFRSAAAYLAYLSKLLRAESGFCYM